MEIDWSKISPEDFEELCWHLLEVNDFKNLQWFGKGGKDRGRDIEGYKVYSPFPNIQIFSKWIVQCKRYLVRAPNHSDLTDTISWAEAHNPEYLLFITTHVLSSDTRDWISETQRRTPFKILVMDRPLLESQLLKHFEQLKPYVPVEMQNEIIRYLPVEKSLIPVESGIVESRERHLHMKIMREQAIDPWINLLHGIRNGIAVVTGESVIESSSIGSVTVNHDISIKLPTDPDFKYSVWFLEHLSASYPKNYRNWKKLKKGFKNYLLEVKAFFETINRKLIAEVQNQTKLHIYNIRGKPPKKYFVPNYLTYIIYSDLKTESSIGKSYFKEAFKIERITDHVYHRETYNLSCGAYASLARGNKTELEKLTSLVLKMDNDPEVKKWIKKHELIKSQLNKDLSRFIQFLQKLSKIIENGGIINGTCEFCKA